MFVQLKPVLSQRRHWYAKPVGLPLQVPLAAVRVAPCIAVPEIVGRPVFAGMPAIGV